MGLNLNDKIPFGVYKGILIVDLIDNNSQYIEWLLENKPFKLSDEAINYLVSVRSLKEVKV